jgi:hypothetical protein
MSKADLIIDLVGIVGAALVIAGAAVIYWPAALILAGLVLLGVAWLGARFS